ncbi:MAG: hypothetical protein ABMA64_33275, partial [Myxococcota bacterium]
FEGGSVRLVSCGTGSADGAAAELARELGVEVKAPTDTVWIHPDGTLTVGPTPDAASGGWSRTAPSGESEIVEGSAQLGDEALERADEAVPAGRKLTDKDIDHIRQGDKGGASGGHDFDLNIQQLEANGYRPVTKEQFNRIVEDEQAFQRMDTLALEMRRDAVEANKALKSKFGDEMKAWIAGGRQGPRPTEPDLFEVPDLLDRADFGLPDDPQKVFCVEPGPGGTRRGAVFPSKSHKTGKAWFPDGTGPDELQKIADDLQASKPGVPMKGSTGTTWTGRVENEQGGYPVVMIDDGNGGVTMTPDLAGWEVTR